MIQQRFNKAEKTTHWTEVDHWLADLIYIHPGFPEYFKKTAAAPTDGIYPTVTVRSLMWALRMKPLPKQTWETIFDRRFV